MCILIERDEDRWDVPAPLESMLPLDLPQNSDCEEEDEEDEFAIFRRDVFHHYICWDEEKPMITSEELLSRAPDLETFWFFERLERVAHIERQDESLEPVPEYPREWPQWRKDSFEQRRAMKRDRQQNSRQPL